MSAYHSAKHRIFLGCRGVAYNRDDTLSRPLQADSVASWSFGLGTPDRRGFGLKTRQGEEWLFREFEHNLANGLAALAMGELLGLDLEAMCDVLRTFPGLPHRCEVVGEGHGLRFINDSKATNPGATLAALIGLSDAPGLVLILGGQGKGADFDELCREVVQRCRAVVLIGEDAPRFGAALPATLPRATADTMDRAVDAAVSLAKPGDAILLSPACASFDMYSGYEERGDAFRASAIRCIGGGRS